MSYYSNLYSSGGASYQQMTNLAKQQSTSAQQLADKNNSFNATEAEKQRSFEKALFNQGNTFNAMEAAKNRDWQEVMSNSAHQREIKDLQAAGLNPILSATGGNGAAVTSGATASSLGAPSGSHATADTSANAAIAQIMGSLMSYMSNNDAMKTSAESAQRIANINSETQKYVSDQAARINKYMSDQSAEASRYASSASMYNAALNAAAQQSMNAAQLANQTRLAQYDFEKQMAYRQYDRETQNQNYERQLYNQEYMTKNYPTNMWQAVARLGNDFQSHGGISNLTNQIKKNWNDYKADFSWKNVVLPVTTGLKKILGKLR